MVSEPFCSTPSPPPLFPFSAKPCAGLALARFLLLVAAPGAFCGISRLRIPPPRVPSPGALQLLPPPSFCAAVAAAAVVVFAAAPEFASPPWFSAAAPDFYRRPWSPDRRADVTAGAAYCCVAGFRIFVGADYCCVAGFRIFVGADYCCCALPGR